MEGLPERERVAAAVERAARAKYERRQPAGPSWDELHAETREQWRAGVRRVLQDLSDSGEERC